MTDQISNNAKSLQVPSTGGDLGEAKFPGQVHDIPGGGIVLSKLDEVINWARSNSLWPLTFATSCCGIEMMATMASDYDMARFGAEVMRFSPRQADLLIVAGIITQKMAPVLKTIYDQMSEPKWVMSFGACASSGGIFNVYSVLQGIDTMTPEHIAPAALFLGSDLCGDRTGHVLAMAGARAYVYKVVESEGKFTEGRPWSAQEIADNWDSIAKVTKG